jgi:hypothetical protein
MFTEVELIIEAGSLHKAFEALRNVVTTGIGNHLCMYISLLFKNIKRFFA